MDKNKKKSFIFYSSWYEVLKDFSSEVRFEVYEAIMEYAISGTLIELKPMSKIAFSFIRKDIDENNKRYDETVLKRSDAGKKGMAVRWSKDKGNNTCYKEITNITKDDNKDEDKDKDVVKNKIDYQKIVERFNYLLSPPLPRVITISESRKKAIRLRIEEHGEDSIENVFQNVCSSYFLKGENGNGWKCYFDWIFNPRNYIKILEGNYANNTTGYSEKRNAFKQAVQQFADIRSSESEGVVREVENPF
jgi:hypothetical protein